MRTFLFLLAALVLPLASSCTSNKARVADEDDWLVLVKSCRLPEDFAWYANFAHHQWIDVRDKHTGVWSRIEVRKPGFPGQSREIDAAAAQSHLRWRRNVEIQAVLRGEEARRVHQELATAVARRGPRYSRAYQAWPGPNSNTFIRELCDDIDGLAAVLDHNAVGKDHDGWISAGLATSETGVRGDLGPFGVTLAAAEGVKLRLLALELGLQAWPPALHLPTLRPIPWSERPADPTPPEAESELKLGDLGTEWMDMELDKTEPWSVNWWRTDTADWIHVACTPGPDKATWDIAAIVYDGERRTSTQARLTTSAEESEPLRLRTPGLEFSLGLLVLQPNGAARFAMACRAGTERPAHVSTEEAAAPVGPR